MAGDLSKIKATAYKFPPAISECRLRTAWVLIYREVFHAHLLVIWACLTKAATFIIKNSVFGWKHIKKKVADVTATPFMLDVFTTLKQEAIVASRIVKSKTA